MAGQDVLGHGNLRDSDPYQSIYTYVDLDGKDENGEYIFEHDANNTSLHPRYEPRDENGVIYGKPYPLFNFSTHFYYKLPAGATELIPPSLLDNTDIPAVKENSSAVKLIHHDYCQIQISVRLEACTFFMMYPENYVRKQQITQVLSILAHWLPEFISYKFLRITIYII